MANLSFLDAIGEMQRRAAISGRPAEKTAMDKLLRENSLRRLSTRGIDTISPEVAEVPEGGGVGMAPQGLEMGTSLIGGTGANAPNAPAAFGPESSVANVSNSMAAALFGMQMGEPGPNSTTGAVPTVMTPLSALNFVTNPMSAIIGKGLQKGAKSVYDLVMAQNEGPEGPPPGVPGPDDVDAAMSSSMSGSGQFGSEAVAGPPSPFGGALSPNSSPNTGQGSGAGAGSPTVLCGELYRQGKLDWQTYLADSAYGRTLPPEVMIGYSVWALPLSHRMAMSPLLSSIVVPFVRAWAYECAYRMGKRKHGTVIGKIMAFFGEPVCGLIGKGLSYASYNKERLHVQSR